MWLFADLHSGGNKNIKWNYCERKQVFRKYIWIPSSLCVVSPPVLTAQWSKTLEDNSGSSLKPCIWSWSKCSLSGFVNRCPWLCCSARRCIFSLAGCVFWNHWRRLLSLSRQRLSVVAVQLCKRFSNCEKTLVIDGKITLAVAQCWCGASLCIIVIDLQHSVLWPYKKLHKDSADWPACLTSAPFILLYILQHRTIFW